ncbi:MmcQ/YjbR family DNA-binding protein [Catenovulum sediminis]|uniref:MmcQ/YjbR family DNA-binding protein n=1 Tax=Catenovulum sediminis TaxID=1740262 RepID=UPI00117CAC91|nr:MmcQ/YjbR family DNA-binding protein [Catenovulum sediminis]
MEQWHTLLIAKPAAVREYPFGPDVAVYKVKNKMFATLSYGKLGALDAHYNMNLKCEPQQAIALRDIFASVIPGYHMNKKHWNTIILDGSIPEGEITRMIDHSYQLVVSKLTKKEQASLALHL